ncbi:DUF664 domain-containing protein [Streptacidiphilus sp. N1-12]|uniref:DUF664 domain-containing protein n=2 Tax=Streptacidiphilus alkalitolerans TaxID=3342712 RepID=A0ABV6WG44_9ACTN
MTAPSIVPLADAFDRIKETVEDTLDGLSPEELAARVDADANSIGWLVWHLTRVQDDHIADAAGLTQVWHTHDWLKRFDLPYPRDAHGYGQSSADVAAFRGITADLLAQYHSAVHAQTLRYLDTLADEDLDRVVDDSWDPPVTLGVRLVSVVSDDLQHVGQAAFVRGVVRRRARDNH